MIGWIVVVVVSEYNSWYDYKIFFTDKQKIKMISIISNHLIIRDAMMNKLLYCAALLCQNMVDTFANHYMCLPDKIRHNA